MARLRFLSPFLPLCFAALFPAGKAAPQSPSVAGVFMLMEGPAYAFDFAAAADACLRLNVTMATRGQVTRAWQRGLETCKFGWVAEQMAVVPRLTSNKNCGKGDIGVVPWFAPEHKKFGVFCFNASDLEETVNASTPAPPQSSTPPTAPTRTSTPTAALVRSSTGAAPRRRPVSTESTEPTSFPSASALPVGTTRSDGISSAPPKPFSPRAPTPSLSRLITSKPADVTVAIFTPASALPRSASSATLSLGAVPTALIIVGVVLLLLMAAGAAWYRKLRNTGRQRGDADAEMWKHSYSEMDLHRRHGAEEEEEEDDDDDDDDDDEYAESDRKYSSDITLCVSSNVKTNSSE